MTGIYLLHLTLQLIVLIYRRSAHTRPAITVQCTRMAPHTRLLSNNNDSDLLEISGMCTTRGRDCGAHYSTLVGPRCLPRLAGWGWTSHTCAHDTPAHRGIEHIFALEENQRSKRFPTSSVNVVPCHHSPLMLERSIGIQLLRYLRKQSLLNILTAVCSVSRGHVQYTGGLGIDKENCKFVLPATCAL